MVKKIIIIFIAIVILLYLVISFWERGDVISMKVVDGELYVIHKRYKGYSIFTLNLHAGKTSETLKSDVYVSSWALNKNGSSPSYKLVSEWKKIASASGDWYSMVRKIEGADSYFVFHYNSYNEGYITRYTFAADTLTTKSRKLECDYKASEICYEIDRYAKHYISNGVIYNTIDFGVFKSLSGKKGYEQFKNIINELKSTFPFQRVSLSSDAKYIFVLTNCKNSQTIIAYDIEKDRTDEITLKNYELGCKGSMEIKDIDSYGGSIYLILDADDDYFTNKPHTRKPYKYIVYDLSNNAEYPVEIKDYYYHISDDFWDVKRHTIYVLDRPDACDIEDIDKVIAYGYISKEHKQINLDQLHTLKE